MKRKSEMDRCLSSLFMIAIIQWSVVSATHTECSAQADAEQTKQVDKLVPKKWWPHYFNSDDHPAGVVEMRIFDQRFRKKWEENEIQWDAVSNKTAGFDNIIALLDQSMGNVVIKWPEGKRGNDLKRWWVDNIVLTKAEVAGEFFLVKSLDNDKMEPMLRTLAKKGPDDPFSDIEKWDALMIRVDEMREIFKKKMKNTDMKLGRKLTAEFISKLRARNVIE